MAMQLNALSGMDLTAAKLILVAAVGAQDFYPLSADHHYAHHVNAVLAEIRGAIGVSGAKPTPEQSGKVARALSSAMTDTLLSGKQREELKLKMGSGGRLPISAYDVTFFRDVAKTMGEKDRFVESAIHTADVVQHVEFPSQKAFLASLQQQLQEFSDENLEVLPVEDRNGTTLTLKRYTDKRGQSELLFVHALRMSATLEVQMVGRLHPQFFELDGIETPEMALAEWVDRYGLPMRRFPGMKSTKLVQDLSVPKGVVATEHRPLVESDRKYWGVETGEANGFRLRNRADDAIIKEIMDRRIMYAYAVDWKKYRADRLQIRA